MLSPLDLCSMNSMGSFGSDWKEQLTDPEVSWAACPLMKDLPDNNWLFIDNIIYIYMYACMYVYIYVYVYMHI